MPTTDTGPRNAAPRSVGRSVLAALRAARWYVGELMGDHDYARYVEHLTRTHPDAPIPTEREFWRARHAAADAAPASRCC